MISDIERLTLFGQRYQMFRDVCCRYKNSFWNGAASGILRRIGGAWEGNSMHAREFD